MNSLKWTNHPFLKNVEKHYWICFCFNLEESVWSPSHIIHYNQSIGRINYWILYMDHPIDRELIHNNIVQKMLQLFTYFISNNKYNKHRVAGTFWRSVYSAFCSCNIFYLITYIFIKLYIDSLKITISYLFYNVKPDIAPKAFMLSGF